MVVVVPLCEHDGDDDICMYVVNMKVQTHLNFLNYLLLLYTLNTNNLIV